MCCDVCLFGLVGGRTTGFIPGIIGCFIHEIVLHLVEFWWQRLLAINSNTGNLKSSVRVELSGRLDACLLLPVGSSNPLFDAAIGLC